MRGGATKWSSRITLAFIRDNVYVPSIIFALFLGAATKEHLWALVGGYGMMVILAAIDATSRPEQKERSE